MPDSDVTALRVKRADSKRKQHRRTQAILVRAIPTIIQPVLRIRGKLTLSSFKLGPAEVTMGDFEVVEGTAMPEPWHTAHNK